MFEGSDDLSWLTAAKNNITTKISQIEFYKDYKVLNFDSSFGYSVLQLFSNETYGNINAFYPASVENTALFNITLNSKRIALDRIDQIFKIKEVGQPITE